MGDTHTHGQKRDLISLLYFFKIGKWAKNKRKVGLWDRVAVCMCLCIPPPLSSLRNGLVKASLLLLGNGSVKHLIVARQWLGKSPPIVARQRLGRNVTAVTNTHVTIEELLDASFWMSPVSLQGKYAISSSQNFLFVVYFATPSVTGLIASFGRHVNERWIGKALGGLTCGALPQRRLVQYALV
jgi:hypothetical protein